MPKNSKARHHPTLYHGDMTLFFKHIGIPTTNGTKNHITAITYTIPDQTLSKGLNNSISLLFNVKF